MSNINNRRLTKKEKYLLKKQEKEKERLNKIRSKKIKKIIMIALPLLLVAGGGWGLTNLSLEGSQRTTVGVPKIEVSPLEYDAGTVSMSAGLVKKTYEIENSGDGDLKLNSIWTSCACTTAILKIGEKISPKFGMPGHGINPVGWSEILKPGEKGELEVTFDPAFHGPQGIGQNLRAVYLSTSDSQNKQVEVRLFANVIP